MTVDSSGNTGTNGYINAAGNITSTGGYVRTALGTAFHAGASVGITQTLNVATSILGSCTITITGGIITGSTC
jgi:hypothetical protein